MRKFLATALIFATSANLPAAESRIHFEKQIWPILERSCLECHDQEKVVNGKRKRPKGGLRIDSPKMMMYGAKGDPVIIPGDAEESSFYYLTVLDKDDDDIMPAKGPILTKAETELLKKWINQGAQFGSWTGSEPKLSDAQINLVNELNRTNMVIYPVSEGAIDLYVDFSRMKKQGSNQHLTQISSLVGNIQELNLCSTGISDLSPLKAAQNLKKLSLSGTPVADLNSLNGLKNLKVLNLYGTQVKDISSLPASLEKLYVGNTTINAQQIALAKKQNSKLKIYGNWDIKEVRAVLALAESNTAHFTGKVEVKKVPKKLPSQGSKKLSAGDIVFDDFESGRYSNWTVTGNAFGDVPNLVEEVPKYQGNVNAVGKYLVNSHASAVGNVVERDKAQGTMTSKEFIITKKWIKFLIGGGKHKDKTCLQLIVDSKVVAVAHGHDHNKMRLDYFDTQKLKGKKAQLKIVDLYSGGWGNIGVDEIIFTDHK